MAISVPPPTNQPLAVKAGVVKVVGARERRDHVGAGEARAGEAAIHIGQEIRRDEPTGARASGPGRGLLDVAGEERTLVLDGALEAGVIEIAEHADDDVCRRLKIEADPDDASQPLPPCTWL